MNAFIVYYYYLSNGLQTSATFQRRFESGFYDDFNTVMYLFPLEHEFNIYLWGNVE